MNRRPASPAEDWPGYVLESVLEAAGGWIRGGSAEAVKEIVDRLRREQLEYERGSLGVLSDREGPSSARRAAWRLIMLYNLAAGVQHLAAGEPNHEFFVRAVGAERCATDIPWPAAVSFLYEALKQERARRARENHESRKESPT